MIKYGLFLSVFLLAATPTLAQQSPFAAGAPEDKKSPLKVTSDKMVSDKKNRLITFEGKAIATKGKLTVKGDRIVVHTTPDQSDFTEIEAFGSVRIIRDDKIAIGDKARYFSKLKKIVMTGNPELLEGKNRAKGEKVVYYFATEEMVIIGGEKSRSELVLYPNADEEPEEKSSTPEARKEMTFGARPPLVATAKPTARPTVRPTPKPTVRPTPRPTVRPTVRPTPRPTVRPTATPTIKKVKKSGRTFYTLHIGLYPNKRLAAKTVITLKKKGYGGYVIPLSQKGTTLYRVGLGKFKSAYKAKRMKRIITKETQLKPSVVIYDINN